MNLIKKLFGLKVNVKNATNTTDNSKNWLEYYFKTKYKSEPFTSMKCPSCNKTMYYKKKSSNIDDNSVMVGGHVTWITGTEYILPICKECNDKKENLNSFKVEYGKLCQLPKS